MFLSCSNMSFPKCQVIWHGFASWLKEMDYKNKQNIKYASLIDYKILVKGQP